MPKTRVKVQKEIQIGAHHYTIWFTKWVDTHERRGLMLPEEQKILLAPRPQNSALMETYIHEVVHVINNVYGVNLDNDETDRMAEGMTQFLIDGLGIEFDWSDIETIKTTDYD